MKLKLLISTFCLITFFCTTAYADAPVFEYTFRNIFMFPYATTVYVKAENPAEFKVMIHYPDRKYRPTAFMCFDLENGTPQQINWYIYLKNELRYTVMCRSKIISTDYFAMADESGLETYIVLHFPKTYEGHFYSIIASPILEKEQTKE